MVSGIAADHVIAYSRSFGGHSVLVICGRLYAKLLGAKRALPLGEAWGDTSIEVPFLSNGAQLGDVLTGARFTLTGGGLALSQVYAALPVAVMLVESGEQ
jgi:maltooligosyltrehalose synthase